ncbi:type II secretion system minor pseudopilin GspI [Sphingomonas naphthae]|uniref:Type II secretion system protein I n=1 Tax=Sphingomonas naphthae TaxID=1813468 RepID=A0ABY7TKH3_9SPHN|nr:type II secretion system minor pseudopilin GspI [Sphingomonas naphthae]WCT72880.1 type II secretion system minor pseudopilin GspI [Sphingomonas naphthae]
MIRRGGTTASASESGFTLIEALVALAILAVASVGLIRATEAHVDSVRGMEGRAAAQWVAENRLAELGLPDAFPAGDAPIEMLGMRWEVRSTSRQTADPDLRAVTVTAHPVGRTSPAATLEGFVDMGTTTAS